MDSYTSGGTPVPADGAKDPVGFPNAAVIWAFLVGPVGVILGLIARAQIRERGEEDVGSMPGIFKPSNAALIAIVAGVVMTAVDIAIVIFVINMI